MRPVLEATLDELDVPLSDAREFAPLLVNTLAQLPHPVTLVIDDVHLIRSRATREQLGFVLLHLPSTLRVVLAARSDPVLPLTSCGFGPRWRRFVRGTSRSPARSARTC